ncbi:MAG TPA: hypothetical protein VIT23_15815 [Terrimicrobiaceae bacterium]
MDEQKEEDALWELLGRARRVKASPYFARKVMRAIQEQDQTASFSWKILLRWFLPTAACAGLVLGWMTYQHQQEDLFNAEFDSAADLESLVASDDSLAWLEDPAL